MTQVGLPPVPPASLEEWDPASETYKGFYARMDGAGRVRSRRPSTATELGLQPIEAETGAPRLARGTGQVQTATAKARADANITLGPTSPLRDVIEASRNAGHVRSSYAEGEIQRIRGAAERAQIEEEARIRAEECRTEPPAATRASWHDYFLEIATTVATRSTCDRKHVGCVLIAGDGSRTILATGYNGSLRGAPHCDDVGHDMDNGSCVRTTHAEANAIAQAARQGARLNGGHAYVTASPCRNCLKLLISAGIERIYCGELYRDDRIFAWARAAGVVVLVRGPEGTFIVPKES
jgi:dCMP deaminase